MLGISNSDLMEAKGSCLIETHQMFMILFLHDLVSTVAVDVVVVVVARCSCSWLLSFVLLYMSYCSSCAK